MKPDRPSQPLPPGFGLLSSSPFAPPLVVPLSLIEALANTADADPPDAPPAPPAPVPPSRPADWVGEMRERAGAVRRPRGAQRVFTLAALQHSLERAQRHTHREQRERDKQLLADIASRGPWRTARFGPRVLEALHALEADMPHLAGVTRQIANRIHLGRVARAGVRLPPLLLVGEPGVGKSHYAEAMARALGAPIHRLAFDSVQVGAALAGSDAYWSNSRPGLVFGALGLGPTLHPVILLDELDKARRDGHGDPLAPLHTLLEPHTARHFVDRCIDLEMDASRIVWIATANDLAAIDAPLRSRFAVHVVRPPEATESLRIARAVAAGLLAEMGLRLEIAPAVFERLAGLGPRAQRQALETAIAEAVRDGETVLEAARLPAAASVSRGMGFLARL